ncbi:hypothetical protein [Curtobacterium sp. HSID17257]|uniref:hypothetical protein n=1 Tax=Curtobacterium sp. HSID17257 TaxID=2419510 RepID=UPI000F8621C5|nr:hypothetical protein [Curtobacterium sp. HSID17257]
MPMPKRTTLTGIAAALLLVPVLLTGCSATGPTSQPTASHEPSQREMLAKLTSCLRDKGYDVGEKDVLPPKGVDEDAYYRDSDECMKGLGMPAAQEAKASDPGMAEYARKLAACMRKEGFSDYPDDFDAQGEYKPAGDEQAFLEADERCAGAEGVQGFSK